MSLVDLVKQINSFGRVPASAKIPFVIESGERATNTERVGYVHKDRVLPHLAQFDCIKTVLDTDGNVQYVAFADDLVSSSQKSSALDQILRTWQRRDTFQCLRKWRNEQFPVFAQLQNTVSHVLFTIERSGAHLFGFRTYGCHLNGYVYSEPGNASSLMLWIARRSKTKATFPGKLDTLVGGGLQAFASPVDTIVREAREEAGLELQRATTKCCGVVSLACDSPERGIVLDTEYVYDCELDPSWQPTACDGEVEAFYCIEPSSVLEKIANNEFMPESAIVTLDFLIRHGFINPESCNYYTELCSVLRAPIDLTFPCFST